ncbi:hypothetical protein [Leeuwenhoekiella nanhaiensis]|uniref:EF-hand domain-containing protein n=1 Tax=Leeuwenhoekiella nanhaiensis TaxID=1655491 RepID=A0A2G1VPK7_9FLAO|nr:hypothetical protein [Leeuwenhoekiella nanhaiensis]PHQ28697.1 hypothetical protein CJ305_12815 [Leeuwenhoekiella nanhaiensis]
MPKLFMILSLILLVACKEKTKTAVNYDNLKSRTEVKRDSTTIILEELPIEIDSTDYVIYIIGEPVNLHYGKIYSGLNSGSGSGESFSILNSYGSDISGNIHNLKFQKLESDDITQLTQRTLRISSISFLRDVFKVNKKQYLLYSVFDQDTNGDRKLNPEDLISLYLSKIDGSGFKKITPELHELIDWKMIKIQNRLYYRTLEDVDKNGTFDQKDKVHYFFVDFDQDELKPREYNL